MEKYYNSFVDGRKICTQPRLEYFRSFWTFVLDPSRCMLDYDMLIQMRVYDEASKFICSRLGGYFRCQAEMHSYLRPIIQRLKAQVQNSKNTKPARDSSATNTENSTNAKSKKKPSYAYEEACWMRFEAWKSDDRFCLQVLKTGLINDNSKPGLFIKNSSSNSKLYALSEISQNMLVDTNECNNSPYAQQEALESLNEFVCKTQTIKDSISNIQLRMEELKFDWNEKITKNPFAMQNNLDAFCFHPNEHYKYHYLQYQINEAETEFSSAKLDLEHAQLEAQSAVILRTLTELKNTNRRLTA